MSGFSKTVLVSCDFLKLSVKYKTNCETFYNMCLGGLNIRNLFPTVLMAEKSDIRMSAWLASGKDIFGRWSFSCYVFTGLKKRGSKVSFYKGANPIMKTPPSSVT